MTTPPPRRTSAFRMESAAQSKPRIPARRGHAKAPAFIRGLCHFRLGLVAGAGFEPAAFRL